jgi:histidinol phosphatase-like PHP family hydrolase
MLSPTACALDADLARELDFVLVACNHYHLDPVENPRHETPESYAAHYIDMALGAVELGFADSITHPFMHDKLGPDAAAEALRHYDERRLSQLIEQAAEARVAFELNPYKVHQAIDWFRDLIQEGRRHGVQFTLGSDAHDIGLVGYPNVDGLEPSSVCQALGLTQADLKRRPNRQA